jgi:hypothetical protein
MKNLTPYADVLTAAKNTTEKLIAVLCPRRKNVTVTVTTQGGETASIGWENTANGLAVTLNLPSLPPHTMMTRPEAYRIVGFIVHEVMHVARTEKSVWRNACAAGAVVRGLTNAIEDVWMERETIKSDAIGAAREVLESTLESVYRDALAKGGPWSGNVANDLGWGIAVQGRIANGYKCQLASTMHLSTPANVKPLLAVALKRLPKVKSTADALALARELAALLAQQPQPQPQEGEGKGEPQEGEGNGPEGNPRGGKGEPQEGAGEPQEGKGEGKGEAGEAKGEGEGEGEPSDKPGKGGRKGGTGKATGTGFDGKYEFGIGNTAKDAAKRDNVDLRDSWGNGSRLSSFKRGVWQKVPQPHGYMEAELNKRAQLLRDAVPNANRLRDHIRRLLKAPESVIRTRYEETGRLDRRSLHRASWGAQNVYTRRNVTPGVSTAVCIVLDGSGSMNDGNKMHAAKAMALALAEAIEAANGEVMVSMFRENWNTGSDAHVTMLVAKDWSQRTRLRAGAIASLTESGGTPLSQSILAGAQAVSTRQVDRRIVLALTDGECTMGLAGVQAAVKRAAQLGVEVIGIGAGSETDVRPMFPVAVNVTDVRKLATEGMGLLIKAMEKSPRLPR